MKYNIPIELFKKYTPGFKPRTGDYVAWATTKWDEGNRCYQPNLVTVTNGKAFFDLSQWTMMDGTENCFIWYRQKLLIVIK